jgi:hypothetical protein
VSFDTRGLKGKKCSFLLLFLDFLTQRKIAGLGWGWKPRRRGNAKLETSGLLLAL